MTDNGSGSRCEFREADHTYWLDGVRIPGVSEVLALAGLEPTFRVDRATLALAAWKGTCVHHATALDDRHRAGLGAPLDWARLDPVLRPYVCAWRKFRDQEPFAVHAIEEIVCHEELRFAGTLDRRGEWKGLPAILDVKSGTTLRWQMGLQLAGYTLACQIGGYWLAPSIAMEVVRVIVQLDAAGDYRVIASDADTAESRALFDPADGEDFLAALRIAHRKLRRPRATWPVTPDRVGDVELAEVG